MQQKKNVPVFDSLKSLCLLSASLFISFSAYSQVDPKPAENKPAAQVTPTPSEPVKHLPAIGLGTGLVIFKGDVGQAGNVSLLTKIRFGYNLSVEQRIGKTLGISLVGLTGKIASNERSATRNLNFESKIIQAGLRISLFTDNDFILKQDAGFVPYISAGLSYLKFDPYGDLKDKNNIPYYYWSDGRIKNIPESIANDTLGIRLERDYTYETRLEGGYSRNTFTFPVGGGIKVKLIKNIDINLHADYYITFTDYLDNFKLNGNDSYIYTSVTFLYKFTKKEPEEIDDNPAYKNIDFKAIENIDTDGDGVKDNTDECPQTPKGVITDSKGCPPDEDKDGVPDYRDKEANTKRGSVVDESGVTQTDKMLAEKRAQDTLAANRSDVFNENPSKEFLQELDKKAEENSKAGASKLPEEFRSLDKNNDGYISSDEITMAIDAFFEGSADITVEKINKLIDFFFDQ